MTRGVRLYLVGSLVLVSLAGCSRGFFQSEEREPWRAEAEIACLKSGAVKENADLVRIDPISGPGVCGAEFPLKVAALGESSGNLGFADEDLRPPANIGNAPRWPISPPRPTPPQAAPYPDNAMRQPGYGGGSNGPISLTAPGVAPQQGEIDLPAEGTPGYAPGTLLPLTRLSAACVLFGTALCAAAAGKPAAARARDRQSGGHGRSGGGQAGGNACLSNRLGA